MCFHNSIRILLPLDCRTILLFWYIYIFIIFFFLDYLLYIYIFCFFLYIYILVCFCIWYVFFSCDNIAFRASPVIPCTRYYTFVSILYICTYTRIYIYRYIYIFFYILLIILFVVDVVVVVTVVVFCSVSKSVWGRYYTSIHVYVFSFLSAG